MPNQVVISSGQTVRFPVSSTDTLAKFQSFQALDQAGNIEDLAIAKAIIQKNPTISAAAVHQAVAVHGTLIGDVPAQILNVGELTTDLIVQPGGTVVFAGPITKVIFANVDLQKTGRIIVHGSLNLTCTSLGDSTVKVAGPPIRFGGGGIVEHNPIIGN
jgi:hypothetical protein